MMGIGIMLMPVTFYILSTILGPSVQALLLLVARFIVCIRGTKKIKK